jgi:transcriptional regulator with XRE-family HTH domain
MDDQMHDDSLNKRLLKLRRLQGLTQKEAAQRMGISSRTLARWEKGDATPRAGNHLQAATFLLRPSIVLPHDGDCYGVRAGSELGIELHGGFATRYLAEEHAEYLTRQGDYAYARVVKIETPDA